jgi:hypothetical protein
MYEQTLALGEWRLCRPVVAWAISWNDSRGSAFQAFTPGFWRSPLWGCESTTASRLRTCGMFCVAGLSARRPGIRSHGAVRGDPRTPVPATPGAHMQPYAASGGKIRINDRLPQT